MAYINGVNNSVSSIYGNRNVISGLASGIDTESMIENSVKGYKTQIAKLMQNRTKVEWQQERYRSIIDKTSSFMDKYTSYSSTTNLLSAGFFNSATNVTAQGANKDYVTATGRNDSNVQILGVKQLATNATFKVPGLGVGSVDKPAIKGDVLEFNKNVEVSNVAGTMTINYGGSNKVDITFGSDELFNSNQEFVDAINDKLSKENITINGQTYKASDRIKVELVKGPDNKEEIRFSDKVQGTGNSVYISSASEAQQKTLGLDLSGNNASKNDTVIKMDGKNLHRTDGTVGEKLSGQKVTFTLDGVARTITLPTYNKDADNAANMKTFVEGIQKELNKAFGDDVISVKNDGGSLKFEVQKEGSTLALSGAPIKNLGFGDHNTSYINTQKNLGQIWGDKIDWKSGSLEWGKAEGKVTKRIDSNGNAEYFDSQGYKVVKGEGNDDNFYRVDDKGNKLFDFKVNGVRVGSFNEKTELGTVLNAINNNSDAQVSASYSKSTNTFKFVSKNGGKAGKFEFDDGLATMMFGKTGALDNTASKGGTYTAGEDAILSMSVDGEEMIDVTRSENTFVMEGLTVTLNGTFNYETGALVKKDPVTFKTSCDTDKVIDAVKAMVKDYNEMVTELKKAFSTLPAQRDNGKYYEPLTEEDREGMSESAIKAHEEKAKQGILFRDRELSEFYDRLTRGVAMEGPLGAAMRHIGITAEYSNGLTTLNIDEQKLRTALETEPDTVKSVFTQKVEDGAKQDGLMQSMKTTMEMYSKVRGGKGILVEKAGSPLAGTTLFQNEMQKKLDQFDEQINKVKAKMGSQIDFYTKQFTQMEQLIAQMNSQSSALAGMMGGFNA